MTGLKNGLMLILFRTNFITNLCSMWYMTRVQGCSEPLLYNSTTLVLLGFYCMEQLIIQIAILNPNLIKIWFYFSYRNRGQDTSRRKNYSLTWFLSRQRHLISYIFLGVSAHASNHTIMLERNERYLKTIPNRK